MFLKERDVREGCIDRFGWIGIRTVIKPIPEVGEAMLDKILGGSEVEPRVDCSMAD
jgi:hypothetical protein